MDFFECSATTGGAAGALDAISIDDIKNRAMAAVATSTAFRVYRFSSSSTAPENAPWVIMPDDATGPGRWLLQSLGVSGGGSYDYACFQHREAKGVNGGAALYHDWNQRPYNYQVENGIDGCQLSGGDIILPSGVYDLTIKDVCYKTRDTRLRVVDASDDSILYEGPSMNIPTSGLFNKQTIAKKRITLSEKTTVGVRIFTEYNNSAGLGRAAGILDNEIFGQIDIERVGEA